MEQDGQNILDYCLQTYGQLDNLIDDLLKDNDLTMQSKLNGGQVLITNENKGNEDIKNFININNFVINNAPESETASASDRWILADGTWNDDGVWIDTKVWID